MLAILFPHLFEELEYLLPSDELEEGSYPPTGSSSRQDVRNSIAGPSRLPS